MPRHIDDVIADVDDYINKVSDNNSFELGELVKDLAEIVKDSIDSNSPFGKKVAD